DPCRNCLLSFAVPKSQKADCATRTATILSRRLTKPRPERRLPSNEPDLTVAFLAWIVFFSLFRQFVFLRQSCGPESLCAPGFFDQEDLISWQSGWALFSKRRFCQFAVMSWGVAR